MNWESLHHLRPGLLKSAGAVLLAVLGVYKSELQAFFKELGKRLYAAFCARLLPQHVGRNVTEAEDKAIQAAGLDQLDSLLLRLRLEVGCDRITVVQYDPQKDGSVLVTCLSEARDYEMPTVIRGLQSTLVDPEMWAEIQRIHLAPDRCRYVQDARTGDVAALREAQLRSGVFSAYYQSLPRPDGKFSTLLSMSWHTQRLLSPSELKELHFYGMACSAVLSTMALWRPTTIT